MVAESLSQNQNADGIPEDVAWEPVPKKRIWRARLASFIICLLAAAGIVYYAVVVENTIVEFHIDDEISKELTETKNKTITCYKKEEKETFPDLLILSFGLLSIILGTFVDRLLLVVEEIFHFKSRHNKSTFKMFKACFSGISLKAVAVVLIIIIVMIIAPLMKKATFENKYFMYILSGIGVGPLVMRLLNLNTESEVHISTIVEQKETLVAHGLAWSYYFNYLEKALPKFSETFLNKTIPPAKNGQPRGYLNSDKMLLLISHDCHTEDDLAALDNRIEKLNDIKHGAYYFPVYRLRYNGTVRRYVVKYVKQPLETLDKMSIHGRIKALNESELEYQVKLLYRTLLDILNKPLNKQCKEKCILIPIKAESLSSLQDGELARLIIHKVECDEHDGFMKPCSAKKEQPKLPKEDETLDADDKTKDQESSPSCSYVLVDMNPAESSVQYSRKEHFTNTDNPADENHSPVYPEEEDTNKLPRDKEPAKGQRQQKSRIKSLNTSDQQPLLSNNDDKSFCVELPEKNIKESEQADDDDGGATMIQSSQVSANAEDQHDCSNCPTGEQLDNSDQWEL